VLIRCCVQWCAWCFSRRWHNPTLRGR
jgi:hypothetical protein